MSEKSLIMVAPLKLVRLTVRSMTARLEFKRTYVQTPHLYVLESTDILSTPRSVEPGYLGISKEFRWLTGWVYLDVLAKKYPEDNFLKRCLDPELRFEDDTQRVVTTEIPGSTFDFRHLRSKTERTEYFERQEIAVFTKAEGREAILVRMVTPAKIKYRWTGWHREAYIAPV